MTDPTDPSSRRWPRWPRADHPTTRPDGREAYVDAFDPGGHVGAWFATWFVAVVAATAVVAVGYSPDTGEGQALATPLGVVGASLGALWSVQILGALVASRRVGSGDVRSDFGLRFRPLDLAGLAAGAAAQLVLVPLVYVPLRAIDGDTFSDERLDDTASDLVAQADGWLIVLLVTLVVVGAPIVEELFYRGFLQRPLLDRFSPAVVVPVVALVFATVHFRPIELPGLFVAGLVFGGLAARCGRIGPAVAAHVGFNAVGLLAVM